MKVDVYTGLVPGATVVEVPTKAAGPQFLKTHSILEAWSEVVDCNLWWILPLDFFFWIRETTSASQPYQR